MPCPADLVTAGVGRSRAKEDSTARTGRANVTPADGSAIAAKLDIDDGDSEGKCPKCGLPVTCYFGHALPPRGISSAEFNQTLDIMKEQKQATTRLLGLSEVDIRQFSIVRACP